MEKSQFIFERYERKYWLTKDQYEMLLPELKKRMTEDRFSHGTVCSIYYDTDDFYLIRRSIEKPKYKEKLRVRSYGTPEKDGQVFVEVKKKFERRVYKRRVSSGAGEVQDFLENRKNADGTEQIQKEIRWLYDQYLPKPKVFIGYERYALYGGDEPFLRITFDTDIRFRCDRLDLRLGDDGAPLLPGDDRILMEVKIGKGMPVWLSKLLADNHIYPGSFSKVGTCYTKYIAGKADR